MNQYQELIFKAVNNHKNKNIKRKYYICPIGKYQQESDTVIVSDPSYNYIPEEHESNKISFNLNKTIKVRKGLWIVCLMISVHEKDYNAAIVCLHDEQFGGNYANLSEKILSNNWIIDGSIGVDSGMAGIYDLKYYQNQDIVSQYPIIKRKNNIFLKIFYNDPNSDSESESESEFESESGSSSDPDTEYSSESESGSESESDLGKNTKLSNNVNNISWYNMNISVQSKPTDYASCIPFGCVSASGYGDGMYDVYVLFDDKKDPDSMTDELVCGIKIVFIN